MGWLTDRFGGWPWRRGPAEATELHVYHVPGRWVLPTWAVSPDGIYFAGHPVEVVGGADADALAAALERMRRRGHPRIPSQPRDAVHLAVPQAVGLSSHRAFDRVATSWTLRLTPDAVVLQSYLPRRGGGWMPAPEPGPAYPDLAAAAEGLLRSVDGG